MTDTREWRVGSHYGIHWYAVNADFDDDEPLGTALSPAIAEQVVRDHSQANRQWEMDATNARVIHRLKDERNDADAKAKRWSEKVEKLADENDELARKLIDAFLVRDHQAAENDELGRKLNAADEKLRRSVCEHDVTKDRTHDLFAENHRLTEKLNLAVRSRVAAVDENSRLSDKLKRNVELTDRAVRSRDELSAENHRLQVELRKAMAVKYLWPIVGDRVRHLRHGGTGTVVATAEGRESTVEVKNEFGEPCHWFLENLEPLYAKDGWVAATDECAD